MPPSSQIGLGARVASARGGRRMTQVALARAAGMSLSMLRKIEQGTRYPSDDGLSNLADALGVDIHRLLGIRETRDSRVSAALPAMRAAIDGYDMPEDGPIRALPELRKAVDTAVERRLASQYALLAQTLPDLLTELAGCGWLVRGGLSRWWAAAGVRGSETEGFRRDGCVGRRKPAGSGGQGGARVESAGGPFRVGRMFPVMVTSLAAEGWSGAGQSRRGGPPPACGALRLEAPDETAVLVGGKAAGSGGEGGARVESAGEASRVGRQAGVFGVRWACGWRRFTKPDPVRCRSLHARETRRSALAAAVSSASGSGLTPTGRFRSPRRPSSGRSARDRLRPCGFGLHTGAEGAGAHETGTRHPAFPPDPTKPQVTEISTPLTTHRDPVPNPSLSPDAPETPQPTARLLSDLNPTLHPARRCRPVFRRATRWCCREPGVREPRTPAAASLGDSGPPRTTDPGATLAGSPSADSTRPFTLPPAVGWAFLAFEQSSFILGANTCTSTAARTRSDPTHQVTGHRCVGSPRCPQR
ncbi:helix-turn-helix domain-containing protein [Embleya sp. NPDC055664]